MTGSTSSMTWGGHFSYFVTVFLMIAGLFIVILIGVVVEYLIFRTIELRTVRRWGMQR